MRDFFRVVQTVTLILGSIGLVLLSSCQQEAHKLLPAYSINMSFAGEQGMVAVEQGGSVTVPLTVRSLVDRSIDLRILLVAMVGQLPPFLQYDVSLKEHGTEFVRLAPGAYVQTQITLSVSGDAQPGDYDIGVQGQLQKPIRDRGGMAQFFRLTVTAKEAERPEKQLNCVEVGA